MSLIKDMFWFLPAVFDGKRWLVGLFGVLAVLGIALGINMSLYPAGELDRSGSMIFLCAAIAAYVGLGIWDWLIQKE